jgi:hypothetical protein
MAYDMGMSPARQRERLAEKQKAINAAYLQSMSARQAQRSERNQLSSAARMAALGTSSRQQVALSPQLQAILGSREQEVLAAGVRARPTGQEIEMYRSLIR